MLSYLPIALLFGLTTAGDIHSGGYGYSQTGYGSRGAALGLAGGYGGGGYGGNGYGLGLGLGLGNGLVGHSPGPLSAAIQTRRTYAVVPVPSSQEPAVPQVIDVEPTYQPVQIIFRSISSPVMVQQIHTPGEPGQQEATHSEDEPHRVIHEVLRPVIQEVREVIQPYRRVTQEVRPVLEEVHTRVAKGEMRGHIAAPIAPVAAAPVALDAGIAVDGGHGGDGYGKGNGLGLGLGGFGLGSGGQAYKSAKKGAK